MNNETVIMGLVCITLFFLGTVMVSYIKFKSEKNDTMLIRKDYGNNS